MSLANQGGYYGVQAGGQPYQLDPRLMLQLLLTPQLRAMLQANGAPSPAQSGGLMSWANSQAQQGPSGRAISPTIPGLTLPPQIQQIMAQKAPLSQIASQLNPSGLPPTGQFAGAPAGVAPSPTSTQAPAASAPSATPAWITAIVNNAIASMTEGSTGNTGGGGPGGGPAPDQPGGGGGGTGGGTGGGQGGVGGADLAGFGS